MNLSRLTPIPHDMSYLSVPGQSPLLRATIGQILDSTVSRFPDREGLVVSDIGLRRTFRELHEEIECLAAGLLSLGLGCGDRVGIWGPNSHKYYVTQFAVWKAGLIVVNINSAFQPNELSFCLSNVGVQCLVIAEDFKTQKYYEMVRVLVPEMQDSSPGHICSAAAPNLRVVVTMEKAPLPGTFTVQRVLEKGRDPAVKEALTRTEPAIQFDDVCTIQFTSGTTGYPKGAMLTHHNVVNNSFLVGKRYGFTEQDRICLTVPLFHTYGCVVGALLALHFGAACVLPARAFSGAASMAAAAKEKCTVVYGTPTMHIAMLNTPDFDSSDLSSLRLACTGAAPCPIELIKEMKSKYGVQAVGVDYGMTETGPIILQSLPGDSDSLRARTVGYPQEHSEVQIVDPDTGRTVPLGVAGELYVRGYQTMHGYWGDPEKTTAILKPSKWLRTGDLALMSSTGHTSIVGRLKDIIIRGGENIYPKEIEDFLYTHPKIMEAHVFGVPDSRMGEEVAAWVCARSGQALTEEEVKTYARGKVAHYKIPKFIRFVDEFPKTASGKVQKFRMREYEMTEERAETAFSRGEQQHG